MSTKILYLLATLLLWPPWSPRHVPVAPPGVPHYAVTDLGTIDNPLGEPRSYTSGWSINRRGDVVGHVGERAILWSGGRMIPLGILGSVAVRENGSVIGLRAPDPAHAVYDSTLYDTVLWSHGRWTDLGPSGVSVGDDLSISAAGVVSGTVAVGTPYPADQGDRPTHTPPGSHAALWAGGRMTDIGTMGGRFGLATAMNDRGQVVGFSSPAGEPDQYGFLWEKGRYTDLGTMPGFQEYAPNAINAGGQVTGWAFSVGVHTSASPDHAFLWDKGKMRDLGTLGGNDSHAYAISDAGQVIGWSDIAGGGQSAFLYSNGRMIDLNALIPVIPGAPLSVLVDRHLTVALAINALGRIVALGERDSNISHVYLLTPTAQIK